MSLSMTCGSLNNNRLTASLHRAQAEKAVNKSDSWTWYRGQTYYMPEDMVKLADAIAINRYKNPLRRKYEMLRTRVLRALGRK